MASQFGTPERSPCPAAFSPQFSLRLDHGRVLGLALRQRDRAYNAQLTKSRLLTGRPG
jgi:hypothetical protein